MTAQLRPLGNKVFVLRDGKETTSAGGIVVSENTVGKSSMGTADFGSRMLVKQHPVPRLRSLSLIHI